MSRVRVLIVDDQALFREGIRTLLSVHGDLEVVGEAADGVEALSEVARLGPDVVLMDLRMPHLGGVAASERITAEHPAVRILILTTFEDDEEVFAALRAGAVGYLLKDSPAERLVEAVRTVARGESFLQPSVAAKVLHEFSRLSPRDPVGNRSLQDPLSNRELEVLGELAKGHSNREIADRLFLAEGTVKNHVTNILGKLGVKDRTQAALRARELGLV